MSFFDELKASLEEAVEIKNGVREPGRVTRYAVAGVKAIRALKPCPSERPAGKERKRHR